MIVGIPRGLLYYEFEIMWKEFLNQLKIEYLVSPKTDKSIYDKGCAYAMHEACLPLKVFLGHVNFLLDKSDSILVGRIGDLGYYDRMCTRYQASIDLVQNTFRDQGVEVLAFNVDHSSKDYELKSFVDMGKKLGKGRGESVLAYRKAKKLYQDLVKEKERNLEEKLKSDKIKILLVGHKYNTYDEFTGKIITDSLKKMGAEIILATDMEGNKADFYSKEVTETMPWTFNRQLLGAINRLRDQVDGIVLLSSFNCGPDSMANEMVIRKIKGKPILNLIVDGQEGIAGMETRLESFMDIILFKKKGGLF
ncbi:MAG: acyl-CoA dehydratase activase-related protein [Anaerococcus sp.]|nr:acyl-CoA dehydratase activase-related protein [Peptoniphilaceae bacterium]MDY3055161.1 acyl-CoA dehydratase activase-related protein [Anaerococcus sp.]